MRLLAKIVRRPEIVRIGEHRRFAFDVAIRPCNESFSMEALALVPARLPAASWSDDVDVGTAVWTPEHVAQLHIAAYRLRPSWPVFSRRFPPGALVVGQRLRPGPDKVFSWAERYLARQPRRRAVLFKWASVMARDLRDPDDTLRAFARELKISWKTFLRARRRACEIIAACLTRDGVPVFYL